MKKKHIFWWGCGQFAVWSDGVNSGAFLAEWGGSRGGGGPVVWGKNWGTSGEIHEDVDEERDADGIESEDKCAVKRESYNLVYWSELEKRCKKINWRRYEVSTG